MGARIGQACTLDGAARRYFEVVHSAIGEGRRDRPSSTCWRRPATTGRPHGGRHVGAGGARRRGACARGEVQRLNADLERRVAARTAQLEAANRELESFAYSVSHDLRSPLRAIDGFSGDPRRGLRRLGSTRGPRRICAASARAAQRMGGLIDGLLNLSRLRREDCAGDRRSERPGGGDRGGAARGRTESPVEVTIARASRPVRRRLPASLLVNLLGNAWKFTRDREHGAHRGRRRRRGRRDSSSCATTAPVSTCATPTPVRRLPAPARAGGVRGHGHRPGDGSAYRSPSRRLRPREGAVGRGATSLSHFDPERLVSAPPPGARCATAGDTVGTLRHGGFAPPGAAALKDHGGGCGGRDLLARTAPGRRAPAADLQQALGGDRHRAGGPRSRRRRCSSPRAYRTCARFHRRDDLRSLGLPGGPTGASTSGSSTSASRARPHRLQVRERPLGRGVSRCWSTSRHIAAVHQASSSLTTTRSTWRCSGSAQELGSTKPAYMDTLAPRPRADARPTSSGHRLPRGLVDMLGDPSLNALRDREGRAPSCRGQQKCVRGARHHPHARVLEGQRSRFPRRQRRFARDAGFRIPRTWSARTSRQMAWREQAELYRGRRPTGDQDRRRRGC